MKAVYLVEFAHVRRSKMGRLLPAKKWHTVSVHVERRAAYAEKNERKKLNDKFQLWRVVPFYRGASGATLVGPSVWVIESRPWGEYGWSLAQMPPRNTRASARAAIRALSLHMKDSFDFKVQRCDMVRVP
jgi:hypothetical protein